MSRCFRFPPPGYETKPRTDIEDLLTKEKHKDTKHRKDKRDNEKREGKESKDREKDRDQSKDKHREKKDKKENHRDKHKKKHKHRDEDKKRILNEWKDEEHAEGQNERKLDGHSFKAESNKNPKLMDKLGRRISNEESGAGNQVGEIASKIQTFESRASSAEKDRSTDNKIVQNITIPEQRRMGIASATGERCMQNGTLHNSFCEEKRRVNGTVKPMGEDANKKIKGKDKTKGQKRMDDEMVQSATIPEQRRMGMASAMEDRSTENKALQFSMCEEKRQVNGMGMPMCQNANKKIEGMEKTKEQEVDGRRGYIHEDRVREKIHKRKNKDTDKEKEKEKEKIRENGEKNKLQHIGKKEHVNPSNVKSSFTPNDNPKIACEDGNLKRKETNGFLHENEMRCNKLSRPASSPQLLLENGSNLDKGHVGSSCASDSHEASNIVKLDRILHKVNKINGVIAVQPPAVLGPPENSEAIRKPPHPDENYLSKILRVPKMEEWPEFDNQDWLFNANNIQQKPKTKVEADESVQVWASAQRIELADVLALPYVIPY